MTQKQYYEDLAAGLIDNNFDVVGVRSRGPSSADAEEDKPPAFGVCYPLTPTNKRRLGAGKQAQQCAQRVCSICKRKGTSYVCSACRQIPAGEVFFCGPKTGRTCFQEHLNSTYDVDL